MLYKPLGKRKRKKVQQVSVVHIFFFFYLAEDSLKTTPKSSAETDSYGQNENTQKIR